jgi:hypothetical protein
MADGCARVTASGHVLRQETRGSNEGHQARKVVAMFRSLPSFVVASAAVLSLGIVAPVQAQELMAASTVANTTLFPVTPLAPAPVARVADDATTVKADVEQTATLSRNSFEPSAKRPMALPAMYAMQAALQALDAHSTYSAINRGAVEANPLMQGVVQNKGAMMAVKAGVAAGTIFLAERMWKRGNRMGAVATMLVANGVTAMVVANNYRVSQSLR